MKRYILCIALTLTGLMGFTTDAWAKKAKKPKPQAYFVHVDPSVHAGEVWKVKIDILDAQPGETFTYHWQSGFSSDNKWHHLEDNAVYSGTHTSEFGFKTKVGATKGWALPFRCKIVGSKSGKFYSNEIMMPDVIPSESGGKARAYIVHIGSSVYAGEVWKVKLDILNAQPGETFTYHWQSGFPQDNTWYHLGDNAVYSGTHTSEFGFKTKVGATKGFPIPFRCKIVGSKSGKFYSTEIMMPDPIPDKDHPTAGKYKEDYPKYIGNGVIEVKWWPGEDNATQQKDLRYLVTWRKKPGNTWYESNIYENITSYMITNVDPDAKYEVLVIVSDKTGNRKFYPYKTVSTFSAPTAGKYVAGYPKAISPYGIKLQWEPATDGTTVKPLKYQVQWMKASESYWSMGYRSEEKAGMTKYIIGGLMENTEYLMRVRVVNANGAEAFYRHAVVKTPSVAYFEQPKFKDKRISVVEKRDRAVTLQWKPAQAGWKPKSELRYKVFEKMCGS
ncbi:fibronectin type III domain-containing protein [Tannerella forsythia]|uniref:fibronectin type III domain-containing protein n=1 Tax=Tannerella forsythia TaxID=28112 RepID=UPI0007649192|nr:fibronectin type III domain-containing protein [Tannerella forsythia]